MVLFYLQLMYCPIDPGMKLGWNLMIPIDIQRLGTYPPSITITTSTLQPPVSCHSKMHDRKGDDAVAGHAPPPPPPPPHPEDPSQKVSPFVKKLRIAPPGYFFQPERQPPLRDLFAAPTGPYFFYGTLSDPAMLQDVLGLETKPRLRPATILGYECKLWGQYPALLDAPEKVVHGAVYHVETEEHGERLASYETDNYQADPCHIEYIDGDQPVDGIGYVFKFVGNARDLSDGDFDLGTWLRRMKRVPEDPSDVKQ